MPGEIDKLFVTIGSDIKGFLTGMGTVSKESSALAGKMSVLGNSMTKYVTVPLLAIGAAALGSAITVEHGLNQIRKITGETGAEFEDMGNIMRDIAKTSARSFEDIGTAVGTVHARTGLMGDSLEELTKKFLRLAKVTQTDYIAVIETSTQVANQWGISAENMGDSLEWLYKIVAETGVSYEQLTGTLTTAAAQLQAAGFDFQTASAMVGLFEKAGVNTSNVMMGLNVGLKKMAKEGVTDVTVAVQEMIKRIKEAPDETTALALSAEYFGRGATEMTKAIRDGNFEVGAFLDTLKNSDTTIDAAAAAARTLGERFNALKNQVVIALEPIGVKLMDALEKLIPVFSKVVGFVADLIDGFSNLPGPVQNAIIVIGGIALLAGPIMKVVALVQGLSAAFAAMEVAAVSGTAAAAVGFGLLQAAIVTAAGVAGYYIGNYISKPIVEAIHQENAWQSKLMARDQLLRDMGGTIEDLDRTMEDLGYRGDELSGKMDEAFQRIVQTGELAAMQLTTLPGEIAVALESKVGYLRTAGMSGMQNYIEGYVSLTGKSKEEAQNIATQIRDGLMSEDPTIQANAMNMMQGILNTLVANHTLLQSEADAIAQSIKSSLDINLEIGNSITSWAAGMINLFGQVASAADNAGGHIAGANTTQPGQSGGHATEFQHGGIVTKPTLALIGEAGPEAVVPLSGGGLTAAGISFYNNTFNLPSVKNPQEFEAWAIRKAQEAVMIGATH